MLLSSILYQIIEVFMLRSEFGLSLGGCHSRTVVMWHKSCHNLVCTSLATLKFNFI